jgi:hypothetical protein
VPRTGTCRLRVSNNQAAMARAVRPSANRHRDYPTGSLAKIRFPCSETTIKHSSITHRSRLVRTAASGLVAVTLVALGGCSDNDDAALVTLTHPAAPAPTLIDLGVEGPSIGDQRIFRFDAVDGDGDTVRTNWIMTTTAVDDPDTDVETRIATGVFTWGDLDDSLILEGEGWYPGQAATLQPQTTLERAIIGGTGRFGGASGFVVSTHLSDGTWEHVFHIAER